MCVCVRVSNSCHVSSAVAQRLLRPSSGLLSKLSGSEPTPRYNFANKYGVSFWTELKSLAKCPRTNVIPRIFRLEIGYLIHGTGECVAKYSSLLRN